MENGEGQPRVQQVDLPGGARRLIMCFDGTWNALESQTNVLRLFRSLASEETACPDQVTFYQRGVGTTAATRIRGGLFGWGVEANILAGYRWLVDNYRPGALKPDDVGDLPNPKNGDELFSRGDLIFLTGFSRGAYTARSLAGLINLIGIVDRDRVNGDTLEATEKEVVQRIKQGWTLYKTCEVGSPDRRSAEAFATFRSAFAHTVKITCVAVWDTVGALGVPASSRLLKPFTTLGRHRFHDTRLARIIEHAYHALAIDEHREDFKASLWTLGHQETLWARDVEQRWFPGAHANVGGGYDDDLLCEAPLYWIAERLADLGVHFRRDREKPPYRTKPPPEFLPDGSEYLSPVADSYGAFMGGFYPLFRKLTFRGRYERPVLVKAEGVNQTVDPSARLKWDVDPGYRPNNLAVSGRSDTGAPQIEKSDLAVAQGVIR